MSRFSILYFGIHLKVLRVHVDMESSIFAIILERIFLCWSPRCLWPLRGEEILPLSSSVFGVQRSRTFYLADIERVSKFARLHINLLYAISLPFVFD